MQKSQYGIYINALKDNLCLYNINVTNCNFSGVTKGNVINGATKEIRYNNLLINGKNINQWAS